MTGDVINKSQLVSIATGVVKATNPTLLKDFGGNLMLTEKWARRVLEKPKWNKCEDTNGIVYPSLQFLEEEKLSFQRNISALVNTILIQGNTRSASNAPRTSPQETWTISVKLELFLLSVPMETFCRSGQFIQGKPNGAYLHHWSNTDKSVELFKEIIFPFFATSRLPFYQS